MPPDSWRPRYDRSPGHRGGRGDLFEHRDRENQRPRYGRSPPRNSLDSGFHFRGAAADHGNQPQHNFTFESSGPQAPRFPAESHHDRRGGTRRNPAPRGRYPPPRSFGARRGKAAHDRQILRGEARERTPEQLEGMNLDSQPRFANIEMALEQSREEISLKRKHDQDEAAEGKKPKWSNPDPYTALPPPGSTGGPKVDILAVIRNSKAALTNAQTSDSAAKTNDDFISFSTDPVPKTGNDTYGDNRGDASPAYSDYTRTSDYGDARDFSDTASVPRSRSLFDRITGLNLPAGPTERAAERFGLSMPLRKLHMTEDWEPHSESPSTPWHDEKRVSQGPKSTIEISNIFHDEVIAYCEMYSGNKEDKEVRLGLIDRVDDVVNRWRTLRGERVEIHAFGSFAVGLNLPGSDMDLVMLSRDFIHNGNPLVCQSANKMHDLARHLRTAGIALTGTLIALTHTKVPLIKYTDKITGLKVDISFENPSGLQAILTVKKWLEEYPVLKPLVILIKQLMVMYNLSEVHTGGIGGYSIICMVVTYLQQSPINWIRGPQDGPQRAGQPIHYGDLLLGFLELFGTRFDYTTTAMQMKPFKFFKKDEQNPLFLKMDRLAIVDPDNEHNDISGGTTKIQDVMDVFRLAYIQLKVRLEEVGRGKNAEKSILGAVWAGNYESYTILGRRFQKIFDKAVMHGDPPLQALPLPEFGPMLQTHQLQTERAWREKVNKRKRAEEIGGRDSYRPEAGSRDSYRPEKRARR